MSGNSKSSPAVLQEETERIIAVMRDAALDFPNDFGFFLSMDEKDMHSRVKLGLAVLKKYYVPAVAASSDFAKMIELVDNGVFSTWAEEKQVLEEKIKLTLDLADARTKLKEIEAIIAAKDANQKESCAIIGNLQLKLANMYVQNAEVRASLYQTKAEVYSLSYKLKNAESRRVSETKLTSLEITNSTVSEYLARSAEIKRKRNDELLRNKIQSERDAKINSIQAIPLVANQQQLPRHRVATLEHGNEAFLTRNEIFFVCLFTTVYLIYFFYLN